MDGAFAIIGLLAVGIVAFMAGRTSADTEWRALTGSSLTRKHPFARLQGGKDPDGKVPYPVPESQDV